MIITSTLEAPRTRSHGTGGEAVPSRWRATGDRHGGDPAAVHTSGCLGRPLRPDNHITHGTTQQPIVARPACEVLTVSAHRESSSGSTTAARDGNLAAALPPRPSRRAGPLPARQRAFDHDETDPPQTRPSRRVFRPGSAVLNQAANRHRRAICPGPHLAGAADGRVTAPAERPSELPLSQARKGWTAASNWAGRLVTST
jgi:hypothetical protein